MDTNPFRTVAVGPWIEQDIQSTKKLNPDVILQNLPSLGGRLRIIHAVK